VHLECGVDDFKTQDDDPLAVCLFVHSKGANFGKKTVQFLLHDRCRSRFALIAKDLRVKIVPKDYFHFVVARVEVAQGQVCWLGVKGHLSGALCLGEQIR